MELYLKTSQKCARIFTTSYSSSFSLASRFFSDEVRTHIYAIYGMTRLADEIVDTYKEADSEKLLSTLETELHEAMKRGYSTNPLLHAFSHTANLYGIPRELIDPFFASMHTDLKKKSFTKREYDSYIHGSAEVVGLMCLRVFVGGDNEAYKLHAEPAKKLGAAFQKVNFLRDIAADHTELGRMYFPGVTFTALSQRHVDEIIKDIHADFVIALPGIARLPKNSRRAVKASYKYYTALIEKIAATPVEVLKVKRIRINNMKKVMLLV